MSAFDYPRLMLTGTAVCSPSTGNNCRFVPLAFFDPVTSSCTIPPRVFIPKGKKNEEKADEIKAFCTSNEFKINALVIESEVHEYVEIAPDVLKDHKNFKDWAFTPLGKYGLDKEYYKLYELIGVKGKRPGHFNYYGTTEFEFRNVIVRSIALSATNTGEKIIKEKQGSERYKDLAELFGAELKINEGLTSKAKMVDSASSVSMGTQIFWDRLSLTKSSEVVFSGKPCKASLRFASASRVFNLQIPTAHCASGTFFSCIQKEDIENGQSAYLLRFFEQYKIRNEDLVGLQIVFNLFEVKENDDLQMKKAAVNNVETKVVVAITPWYKGDLKSISMGRQLNAGINYLKICEPRGKVQDYFMSPVVAHVDYDRQYLMLDLINNIPELYTQKKPKKRPNYPIPGRDNDKCFKTLNTGMLICKLYKSGIELGRIGLNEVRFSRQRYLDTAGKVILYNKKKLAPIDYRRTLLNERIALYLYDNKGRKNLIGKTKDDYVMLESEYMLATNCASLYASVNDDPAQGYRSYNGKKEPCQITIYKKGLEYSGRVPITIVKCEVKPWNLEIRLSTYRMTHYKNNDILSFPTEKAFNGLYLLYANIDTPTIEKLDMLYGKTGYLWYYLNVYFNSYVGVRILPHKDYSEYLDFYKKKRKQVTFEVLKKEIFDSYDLLYPAMSRIFPFEEHAMRSYQDHLYNLMSLDNWENSSFMPVSRDLTHQQFRLFLEWMQGWAFPHSAKLNDTEPPLHVNPIIPR